MESSGVTMSRARQAGDIVRDTEAVITASQELNISVFIAFSVLHFWNALGHSTCGRSGWATNLRTAITAAG